MKSKLFDTTIIKSAEEAVDFITNILESSTEYSIIGKDLDGGIVLWNEGARRIYGYEPEEVVGIANASILHTPEDCAAGKPQEICRKALSEGKWEEALSRACRNGEPLVSRVVLTPRRDSTGHPTGFLLISRDMTNEEQWKRGTNQSWGLLESALMPW